MKKLIFSLIVITSFVKMSWSQTPKVGLQAGTFYNVLSYEGEGESNIGFSFGTTFLFPVSTNWAFRPEVNYQIRRLVYKDSYSYSSHDYSSSHEFKENTNYSYLEFPILFQFKGYEKGFGFFFGPQYGLLLGIRDKVEYSATYTDHTTGESETYNENYSDKSSGDGLSEISFVIGSTYTFDFGLSRELRLQRSIVMLYKGESETGLSWSMLQLGTRYSLPMSK